MAYLSITELKLRSTMPSTMIDELESVAAGWIDATIDDVSGEIDSRLRKRYDVPFTAPIPRKVKQWVADLVTPRLYLRLGVSALDSQFQSVEKLMLSAKAEIKEAADAVNGLFDLPLRSDTTTTGIGTPGTLAYSEASPYVAFDAQRLTGIDEDDFGEGTSL